MTSKSLYIEFSGGDSIACDIGNATQSATDYILDEILLLCLFVVGHGIIL